MKNSTTTVQSAREIKAKHRILGYHSTIPQENQDSDQGSDLLKTNIQTINQP